LAFEKLPCAGPHPRQIFLGDLFRQIRHDFVEMQVLEEIKA